jgi:adenylate cyclase
MNHSAPPNGWPELTLVGVRRMLEGVIPPAMCSVSADGVPHVNYLSHAEYVDPEHVALTFQFLNRSRVNVLANGRIALCIDDPYTGASVTMQLQYLRTETSGPLFERLRAKLAGIASHSGMEKVFKLQGADIYRVLSLRRVDKLQTLPCLAPRCDLAAGARTLSQRLADAPDLPTLLQSMMDGLQSELGITHAILWLLDEQRQGLFTIASCGYEQSGVGAEMLLADAGLTGVAVREEVPIRIGHMTTAYIYGKSWRQRAQALGLDAVIQQEIPLPGMALPRSQLAVPLRARGRTVGALLLESDRDQFFSYDDEDVLTLLGAQLAQALSALQAAEIEAGLPPRPQEAPGPASQATQATHATDTAAPLQVRHYSRDNSVFVDEAYLIKGVAGAILWKLVQDVQQRGRSEFTTRELRLAGGDLRLPEVQDNLGVRLLLLERRLAERQCGLAIERIGRGRFKLQVTRPLVLAEATG